jgi:fibronectin type 3 domain-containing protein
MKIGWHLTATAPIAVALALGTILLPAVSARAASPVYSDDFETGTLAKWTQVSGVVAQQTIAFDGSWAARASVAGTPGYAYESMSPALANVYLDVHVNLRSASTSVNVLRLRTSTGSGVASVKVNAKSKLAVKNDVSGATTTSATTFSKGVWHELQVHALVSGTSSAIEVWLDGLRVDDVSGSTSLATTPVGEAQIGSNASTTMDVAFDDVIVDTAFIGGGSDTTPPTVPQNLRATTVAGNRVDLSWDASSDALGVTGYTIYRDGSPIGTTSDGFTTTFSDTTVAPLSNYAYTVDAFDAATNRSAQSSPALQVSTPALDTSEPTAPTGLTATAVGSHRVDLSWTGSTDDVAVTGYTIYRDGSTIGATPDGSTITFSDMTAASGATYSYTVDAFDAAGNHSDLSDPASATTAATAAPVVLIVEENHSYSSIIGNAAEAPFLNQMASGGLSATRDVELTGGSKPNYIGLTAGQTMKGISGSYSIDNLFNQMHLAGISEKSYQETMPSPCYTKGTFGTAPAQYVKGHDPAANFTDVTSDAAFCRATLIPAGTGNTASQLIADAQSGTLPAFSFVTPNNCDNMHSCSIGTADAFLANLVPTLTAAGAIVIVTWDEGSTDNSIPLIEYAPGLVSPGTYAVTMNHYNLLAALEDRFGLPRLGNAVGVTPFPIP